MDTRKIIGMIVVALALGLALTGAGCSPPDPCATLPPPTSVEQSAANGGSEVERELTTGGYAGQDCELVNGRWALEQDR